MHYGELPPDFIHPSLLPDTPIWRTRTVRRRSTGTVSAAEVGRLTWGVPWIAAPVFAVPNSTQSAFLYSLLAVAAYSSFDAIETSNPRAGDITEGV